MISISRRGNIILLSFLVLHWPNLATTVNGVNMDLKLKQRAASQQLSALTDQITADDIDLPKVISSALLKAGDNSSVLSSLLDRGMERALSKKGRKKPPCEEGLDDQNNIECDKRKTDMLGGLEGPMTSLRRDFATMVKAIDGLAAVWPQTGVDDLPSIKEAAVGKTLDFDPNISLNKMAGFSEAGGAVEGYRKVRDGTAALYVAMLMDLISGWTRLKESTSGMNYNLKASRDTQAALLTQGLQKSVDWVNAVGATQLENIRTLVLEMNRKRR